MILSAHHKKNMHFHYGKFQNYLPSIEDLMPTARNHQNIRAVEAAAPKPSVQYVVLGKVQLGQIPEATLKWSE